MCPSYLMKTPAGLVVLASKAVGASQVEEHHGASRGHTARVAHGDLLPCCGWTDGYITKKQKTLVLWGSKAKIKQGLTTFDWLVSFIRSCRKKTSHYQKPFQLGSGDGGGDGRGGGRVESLLTLFLFTSWLGHGHVANILWTEVSDGVRYPVQWNQGLSSIEVT